jgi:hypothetical protein
MPKAIPEFHRLQTVVRTTKRRELEMSWNEYAKA